MSQENIELTLAMADAFNRRGWGHGAGSATPIIDLIWQPLRRRNGKCVWWHNCSTEAEALEAAAQKSGRRPPSRRSRSRSSPGGGA